MKASEVEIYEENSTGKEVVSDGEEAVCDANIVIPSQYQVSCWVQLVGKVDIIATDLIYSVRGDEFAFPHNQNSTHFTNDSKFKRCILKHMNDDIPMSWAP